MKLRDYLLEENEITEASQNIEKTLVDAFKTILDNGILEYTDPDKSEIREIKDMISDYTGKNGDAVVSLFLTEWIKVYPTIAKKIASTVNKKIK